MTRVRPRRRAWVAVAVGAEVCAFGVGCESAARRAHESLCDAALSGNVDGARRASERARPDAMCSINRWAGRPIFATPLMIAARRGDLAMVDLLLSLGADVRAVDNEGNTALHWAAAHSDSLLRHAVPASPDARVVRRLIEAGAPVDATNAVGSTALQVARGRRGLEEVAEALAPE